MVVSGSLKTKENFKLSALKVVAVADTRGGPLQEIPNTVI